MPLAVVSCPSKMKTFASSRISSNVRLDPSSYLSLEVELIGVTDARAISQ